VLQLKTIVKDLATEGGELYSFLLTLSENDWQKTTLFNDWTIADVVAHLYFGDYLAVTSNRDGQEFLAFINKVRESNLSLVEFTRRWLGDEIGLNINTGSAILGHWRKHFIEMCKVFEASDPYRRITWAGPDMGIKMFATARLMETWAHSWAIYDVLGITRNQTDRIRHVAAIGARTFGWTFSNRKLKLPGPAPHLVLTSPSGEIWQWHEAQRDNSVVGDAVEFCQVVTQVRNVTDTQLKVSGETANSWLAIAQCFAGPPEEPPRPSTRCLSNKATNISQKEQSLRAGPGDKS